MFCLVSFLTMKKEEHMHYLQEKMEYRPELYKHNSKDLVIFSALHFDLI